MNGVVARSLLSAFGIGVFVFGVWHFAPAREITFGSAAYAVPTTEPADVSAAAWLVFDVESGQTLLSSNEQAAMPIASVSKLLSALVAVEDMDLQATATVSARAVATEGRAGRFVAGDALLVRELLFPLLLESSNDAAEALADAYGSEALFVEAMNDEARSLGMRNATFADASGLSAEDAASAEDLKVLLMHLWNSERHLLDITLLPQYAGVRDWQNNNPFKDEEGYQGGKQGFTDEAGKTFAGIFMERLNGEERPIGIVLLKSENLVEDARELRSHVRTEVTLEEQF